MRIRTVKPEFWTHPVTGRWRGELQAFAISLLNASDDEGYFYADPASVRSAVRPFDEDSKTVRQLLGELKASGWIVIATHDKHGDVGQVVNFDKHQRIDRPRATEIGTYFLEAYGSEDLALDEASTKPRRSLDDRSLLEGNREQGRDQVKEQGPGTRETAPSGALEADRVDALGSLWNVNKAPEQPECLEMSAKRRKAAAARLKERPLPEWVPIVKRIAASPFCRGGNDRGWRADIDFLLRPDTATKVLEGKYDDRGTGPPPRFQDPRMPGAVGTFEKTGVVNDF